MMRLIFLCLALPLVLFAQDGKEILQQSVHLFSHSNIRFLVHSTVQKPSGTTKRDFIVARGGDKRESNLLIRFMAPSTLRCTTILTKKRGVTAQTYVYFPSIGRVRIIPRSKENSEAVGLGISYAELHDLHGTFLPLETVEMQGKTYYKVTREISPGRTTVYLIDKKNHRLKKILDYRDAKLVKKIVIDKIGHIDGEPIVMAWHIDDHAKKRVLRFEVDESSVTSHLPASLFKKNHLKRCNS